VSLTREQIVDYATHYITPEEITDFPTDGDLFCMMSRELPKDRTLGETEGWQFAGYNIATSYTLDQEAKPIGKWVWFAFVSLMTFPPHPTTLKLQPPHVARGRFQDPGRTHEFQILKMRLDPASLKGYMDAAAKGAGVTDAKPAQPQEDAAQAEILQFPRKKKGARSEK
jgi:hypothetical protein